MKARGAVFGQKFGWERPNWFATGGMAQQDDWSFRRSRWFEAVGREVANVTHNAGLLDMTSFAKCRVAGPGAEAFLDGLVANALPKSAGGIALCHVLGQRGGILSEFTILRETSTSFTWFQPVAGSGWTTIFCKNTCHGMGRSPLPN